MSPSLDPTPLPAQPPSTPFQRLDSWKQIAAYFDRDIRTVQLWEKKEALPIHRHEHITRSSVYAFRHELDAWLTTRQTVRTATAPPPHSAINRRLLLIVSILCTALLLAGIILLAAHLAHRSTSHLTRPIAFTPQRSQPLFSALT